MSFLRNLGLLYKGARNPARMSAARSGLQQDRKILTTLKNLGVSPDAVSGERQRIVGNYRNFANQFSPTDIDGNIVSANSLQGLNALSYGTGQFLGKAAQNPIGQFGLAIAPELAIYGGLSMLAPSPATQMQIQPQDPYSMYGVY